MKQIFRCPPPEALLGEPVWDPVARTLTLRPAFFGTQTKQITGTLEKLGDGGAVLIETIITSGSTGKSSIDRRKPVATKFDQLRKAGVGGAK